MDIKIKETIDFKELTPRQNKQTLKNYEIYNEKQKAVYNDIMLNKSKWYLFFGKPGTGKGHIAIGLYKEKKTAGKKCAYIQAFELLQECKSDYFNSSNTMKFYIEKDFLIIDEIEKFWKGSKDAEREILFYILNMRYEYNRQTILITNLDEAEEINALLGPALIDRFNELGSSKYFNWDSYRNGGK